MSKSTIFAALLLFVCIPSASAQTARVTGLVLDSLSRERVDSEVRFYAPDGTLQHTAWADGLLDTLLPAGQYHVVAVPPASPYDHSVVAWPNVPCGTADVACALSGTLVNVTGFVQLQFNLSSPHGGLRGRVVDDVTGEPLLNGIVTVTGGVVAWDTYLTYERGVFLAYPLRAGAAYALHIEVPGYQPLSVGPYSISAGPVELSDIRLKRSTGTITGTVRDTGGQPVAGLFVAVRGASGTTAFAKTDADGRYVIPDLLPAGSYGVVAEGNLEFEGAVYGGPKCPSTGTCDPSGGTAVVISDANVTADFTLRRYPRVTGRVTDAATGEAFRFLTIGPGWQTDADGVYRVSVRDASELRLSVQASGYVRQFHPNIDCVACDIAAIPAIQLQFDAVTTADFALHRPSRFTGKVTAAADGKPLDGVDIIVTEGNGAQVATARTGTDGTFRTPPFAGVADYFVRALSGGGRPD
jgi:hypothetical protein